MRRSDESKVQVFPKMVAIEWSTHLNLRPDFSILRSPILPDLLSIFIVYSLIYT